MVWGKERKKRKREERLDLAIRVLERAEKADDLPIVLDVYRRELAEALAAAADSELAPRALEVLRRHEERERQRIAKAESAALDGLSLAPCDSCGSGDLLVSRSPAVLDEALYIQRALAKLPIVVVICRACGVLRWHVPDPSVAEDLRTVADQLAFAPVTVGAKAPYR